MVVTQEGSSDDAFVPRAEVVDRLVHEIVKDEDRNDRSKKYSDQEMVRMIAKKIEGEVKCYSNQ